MRYIALLPMSSYLEQYCRFHGGTIAMPGEEEEVVNISFNQLASRWLPKFMVPFANMEVARERAKLPDVGTTNGKGEKWVAIGLKTLPAQLRKTAETKDTVYVLCQSGRSLILDTIQTVFDTSLIEDWQKFNIDYKKSLMLPEKKMFVSAWLEGNGISFADTEYEAVMKRLSRMLASADKCVPIDNI